MKLTQHVRLKQTLKLQQILTPKLIQLFKLFQSSYSDLVDTIQEEVKDNVLLEVVQYDQLTSWAQNSPQSGATSSSYSQNDSLKDISDYAISTNSKSLFEHLSGQLKLLHLGPKELSIATSLIEDIDSRGYFSDYDTVASSIESKFHIPRRKVNDVMKIIQNLEPDGVGARSVKECLLIQIDHYDFDNEHLRDILNKVVRLHLDDLADKNYAKIAKALDIEVAGVEAVEQFIQQNLDPNPGKHFSSSKNTDIIIPSFQVDWKDNHITLTNLEEEKGIKVGLSDKYQQMLDSDELDKKTRDFLKEKLNKAKEWIQQLEERKRNFERLVQHIIDTQQKFVEKGPLFLVPLLQKDVAQFLSVSNSTVSRIVSSKYIQTPFGIFSLKQLCPRNHFGKTKQQLEQLLALVINENPTLSDEKIKRILHQDGIFIARRTIAKYRKELGILSSFDRKDPTEDENQDATNGEDEVFDTQDSQPPKDLSQHSNYN